MHAAGGVLHQVFNLPASSRAKSPANGGIAHPRISRGTAKK
jgi:hypothetical protein